MRETNTFHIYNIKYCMQYLIIFLLSYLKDEVIIINR